MAITRTKTAPSHYPFLPFHLIRIAQLVSSLIVGGIMCYFIYHLHHEHYSIPWTFIFLLTSALISAVSIWVTSVIHCCFRLNPLMNMMVNLPLAALWVASFGSLTYWMRGTLSHVCDASNWREDTGIMVCRIYKALFAFALVGVVSALSALALDLYVRQTSTRRGVYNQMQDFQPDQKPPQYSDNGSAGPVQARRSPFSDSAAAGESNGPYRLPQPLNRAASGYALPEDQFRYDEDTTYQGGHEARALG